MLLESAKSNFAKTIDVDLFRDCIDEGDGEANDTLV